ncbi:CorA-like Mg2+ transporter protein, putative [Babesia microti strain RI]|uniref:CorA-like Mg2+ transporter protein, putative n=1 Tax=Babesia microti (strain RI) TaxID=1133968 RepID=A0A1N6LWN8_BABMR|nr:CorA-like Mg2+ transporter protein, putative [Babesia microti strain RI]SIO73283.1 CorA-like Mg2+ transporter protein, putative [Babesia microti strain RI]|eukprot:XP_021337387.1 CorA-like Mg2+ transporter protein, putative [Babesia microti strain RI]
MDVGRRNSTLQSILSHGGQSALSCNKKIHRHLVIEIYQGHFLMLEMSVGEMLSQLRSLTLGKSDICNSIGAISYRDCKLILTDFKQIPNIESRTGCIIVTMPPVVSIITKDHIYVIAKEELNLDNFLSRLCEITKFTSTGSLNDTILENIEANYLPDYDKNVTLLALECCISVALEHLKQDVNDVQREFEEIKSRLRIKMPYNVIMDGLHSLKQPIGNTQEKVGAFARIFCDIVNDTADIAKFELINNDTLETDPTMSLNGKCASQVNRDLEILFEYFDQEVAQYAIEMRTLVLAVQDLESHISINLSFARNQLLRLDLMCNVICSGFTFGACISGIFGMNLKNAMENSVSAFVVITSVVVLCCILPMFFIRILFKRNRI